ncbi:MAG: ankyrin repeat domain-containing protein [Saprospiraceae bacterium]|nr:ankyrin repeat domain-containing protein [Saprospiraceae bacterium]
MLSILTYLIIAGMLIFLAIMSFETKSGGDAATRGLGKSLILLPVAAIVFLVVFNLPTSNWIKYFGLAIGLLCFAALVIFLLALSGSSLVFQDTRTTTVMQPHYEDPILTKMFVVFHEGKVKQWKTLLQSHPEHVQHKQLLQDILSDVTLDEKSNPRKLESVKYMLDAGAKIGTDNCGIFAILVRQGRFDFVELLLQHGTDTNCIPDEGQTVLGLAVEGYYEEDKEQEKVIDLLVKYGADLNAKIYDEQHQDSLPPLLYAAYYGKWHCCQTLLKNGADPYYKNKDGVSIKDFILKEAEKSEDQLYYQDPDFLKLVEQIKQYQ